MDKEIARYATLPPVKMREAIQTGDWKGPTSGLCPGYTQVNVVILPKTYAFHFLLFCQRNPKPCPLLEVMEEGVFETRQLAPGGDIRTDCPKYRVFEKGGAPVEKDKITDLWRDDFVTFLLGCSFTFEQALIATGIAVRHIDEGKNVPMFITNIPCTPAGPFEGNMVVTMRPVPGKLVPKAVQVTTRYPGVHGAPIYIGDPEGLGIKDLNKPDFGDSVEVKPGEVPVFWACGVTPQVALLAAKPDLAITHAPGHMFITDRMDEEFAIM